MERQPESIGNAAPLVEDAIAQKLLDDINQLVLVSLRNEYGVHVPCRLFADHIPVPAESEDSGRTARQMRRTLIQHVPDWSLSSPERRYRDLLFDL